MRFVHSSIALPYLLQRSDLGITRMPSLGVSSLDLGPHGKPLRLFFRLGSGKGRCGALRSDHLHGGRGAAWSARASRSLDAHAFARRRIKQSRLRRSPRIVDESSSPLPALNSKHLLACRAPSRGRGRARRVLNARPEVSSELSSQPERFRATHPDASAQAQPRIGASLCTNGAEPPKTATKMSRAHGLCT